MIKKIRFIDLDLPSKILWGNRNLENNKYYQWGDLRGYSKSQIESRLKIFDYEHYRFYKNGELTKYNDSDNLLELLPEDDIVTLTLGKNYRIPRREDFEELLEYTEQIYNSDSVIFKSIVNKNQIIFPLFGYASGSSVYEDGLYCHFWSSSLYGNLPSYAWKLNVNGDRGDARMSYNSRFDGYVIRPIKFKI